MQGSANQYKGIFDCVGTIMREEGPHAFLKVQSLYWTNFLFLTRIFIFLMRIQLDISMFLDFALSAAALSIHVMVLFRTSSYAKVYKWRGPNNAQLPNRIYQNWNAKVQLNSVFFFFPFFFARVMRSQSDRYKVALLIGSNLIAYRDFCSSRWLLSC